MATSTVRGRRSLTRLVLAAGLVLVWVTTSSVSAAGCRGVGGTFTLVPVYGPDCASAVGICSRGRFRGDLRGRFRRTATAMIATGDSPSTGVQVVVADGRLRTGSGHIYTKETLAWRTIGQGSLAGVGVVIGGSGDRSGSSGELRLSARYHPSDGGGGTYHGRICTS